MTLSRPRIVTATLLAAVLGTLVSRAALAQNDIVFFKNGDRLTGEVKGLDRGKISFDTSATGVINLEWDEIGQLYSRVIFKLALTTGEEVSGTLVESTTPGEIRVQTTTETRNLPLLSIVRMAPIQSKVIERIDMSVNAGYSVAKANDLEQKAFGYDFEYRDQRRHVTFNIDSSLSNSENDPSSERAFANFAYRRFRPSGVWDPFGIGQVERNDELSVDLRQTFGAGMTRWLRDTNASRISFGSGLAYSSEDDFASSETKSDVEALVTMDLEWFRYDEPELDVSTQINLFRRLSGSKEPRGNLDVTLRWEIFKDLFWGFSLYYTFDQQSDTAVSFDLQSDTVGATTDYGAFTSLGWKL